MLYQVEQRGRQTAFVGEDGAGLVGLYPLLARAAAIAENENSSFAEALSLAAAERGTPLRRVFADEAEALSHAHGTVNLDGYTSSGEELLKAATSLYDRIVDKTLLARRLTLCANHLLDESSVPEDLPEQIDLFTDYSAKEKQKKRLTLPMHGRENSRKPCWTSKSVLARMPSSKD